MELDEQRQDPLATVAVSGRVDGATAPVLEQRLKAVVERGDCNVLLDCAEMDYISSAGLRALLVGAKSCQQNGGRLVVCGLRPACKTVFEVSGFFSFIDCHDTRDDALLAAKARLAGE